MNAIAVAIGLVFTYLAVRELDKSLQSFVKVRLTYNCFSPSALVRDAATLLANVYTCGRYGSTVLLKSAQSCTVLMTGSAMLECGTSILAKFVGSLLELGGFVCVKPNLEVLC